MANLVVEKRGRTIHLLKQQSKPVPENRKRRKIALASTPEEFAKKDDLVLEAAQPMQVDQVAREESSDKASAPKRARTKAGHN